MSIGHPAEGHEFFSGKQHKAYYYWRCKKTWTLFFHKALDNTEYDLPQ
jgi:hypothetical protein